MYMEQEELDKLFECSSCSSVLETLINRIKNFNDEQCQFTDGSSRGHRWCDLCSRECRHVGMNEHMRKHNRLGESSHCIETSKFEKMLREVRYREIMVALASAQQKE